MSAKYDEVLTQLGRLNDKNFSLAHEEKNLRRDLSITQKSDNESKTEVDNPAQYLRRDCVEIIGLKPTEETTCVDLVMAVDKDIGVISAAHLLPTRNRDADNKLGRNLRNIKDLTGLDLTKKVYISESLTLLRKKLFGS